MKLLEQPARLLLILLACALPGFAQVDKSADEPPPPPSALEYNPKAWKEFSSETGRFSVSLPVAMTETVERIKTKDGERDLHLFSAQTFAGYHVMYMSFPVRLEGSSREQKLLDEARDGGVADVKGQLLEERKIKLDGRTGRALKVRAAGGEIIRSRLYVAGNRLYVVSIVMRDGRAPAEILRFQEETATRFLDSFKLRPAHASAASQGASSSVAMEGEVDRLLKTLRERNERVIGLCTEDDPCSKVADFASGETYDKADIGGGEAVEKPNPSYPQLAKAARASGTVRVKVIVDETGKVVAAQAVSGHPLLQGTSVKAARQAVFTPTLWKGMPVKVGGVITYKFRL